MSPSPSGAWVPVTSGVSSSGVSCETPSTAGPATLTGPAAPDPPSASPSAGSTTSAAEGSSASCASAAASLLAGVAVAAARLPSAFAADSGLESHTGSWTLVMCAVGERGSFGAAYSLASVWVWSAALLGTSLFCTVSLGPASGRACGMTAGCTSERTASMDTWSRRTRRPAGVLAAPEVPRKSAKLASVRTQASPSSSWYLALLVLQPGQSCSSAERTPSKSGVVSHNRRRISPSHWTFKTAAITSDVQAFGVESFERSLTETCF
mmetsp:Transcript_78778/g.202933  ORF Transcript_78778/g.202933 Transcript_78778/m.202933 type:complete len:266 (-) Transcript_78778:79-876(-)